MLAHRFNFYQGFRAREGRDPGAAASRAAPSSSARPTATSSTSNWARLANADEKYFKHKQPLWNLNIDHTTYDEVWQSRAIWKYLKNIKPAVMLVGGWYDTEDPQGLLRQHEFMEKNGPPAVDMLVMGPWNHGGFARGDGDRLGNVNFGSKTARLLSRAHRAAVLPVLPEGPRRRQVSRRRRSFRPGMNQWRKFDTWPPARRQAHDDLSGREGRSSPGSRPRRRPSTSTSPTRTSPSRTSARWRTRVLNSYMTEDQRFAATRPDVLVYKTDVLDHDVNGVRPDRGGPEGLDHRHRFRFRREADRRVSRAMRPTTTLPRPLPRRPARRRPRRPRPSWAAISSWCAASPSAASSARASRSRCPFEPGKPDRITFAMPDIAHTFRAGPPHHGADSEQLVPADGSQSAEVHGDSEGAVHRFRESDAARLHRRRGRLADSIPNRVSVLFWLESATSTLFRTRRDGRVVEGARLESVYRGNSIEGSNPSLSASLESTT